MNSAGRAAARARARAGMATGPDPSLEVVACMMRGLRWCGTHSDVTAVRKGWTSSWRDMCRDEGSMGPLSTGNLPVALPEQRIVPLASIST
jgi:hypothetical protein